MRYTHLAIDGFKGEGSYEHRTVGSLWKLDTKKMDSPQGLSFDFSLMINIFDF